MDRKNLDRLRSKYTDGHSEKELNPIFQKVSEKLFNAEGTRNAPYAGISTLLSAPYMPNAASSEDFENLQVALVGVPMDLGVSNRPGARFGPRAMRTIERIGPYNHELDCMPVSDLRVGDIGDVPFRSRFSLENCHEDIESFFARIIKAGVVPLAVGGDHSVTHPILRAFGSDQPVGMIHFDAHCDTGGEYDGSKFHHGGPFRNAVLDGVLDPTRSIQIGIRGSSEYLWEFSEDAGMTVMHIEDINRLGCDAVIAKAREVVGDGPVYVTFDVDALDPAFAPG
ncbi:MAG: arginase family protein, partial [Woeseia sp.]